jgi:hypothetical protein
MLVRNECWLAWIKRGKYLLRKAFWIVAISHFSTNSVEEDLKLLAPGSVAISFGVAMVEISFVLQVFGDNGRWPSSTALR